MNRQVDIQPGRTNQTLVQFQHLAYTFAGYVWDQIITKERINSPLRN